MIDGQSIVHEASVSVPLTDLQTRLIAGQIPDWSGYEYLQPTLNKLITHNLLFDFTLPTAYTGAGRGDHRAASGSIKSMLANMNASTQDAGQHDAGAGLPRRLFAGEYQGFGFAGVHGKAANFMPTRSPDRRPPTRDVDLFEVDGYFIRGDWTLQGQLSYGQQKDAAITPDPARATCATRSWYGPVGAGRLQVHAALRRHRRASTTSRTSKNGGGLLGYTGSETANGIGTRTASASTDGTAA